MEKMQAQKNKQKWLPEEQQFIKYLWEEQKFNFQRKALPQNAQNTYYNNQEKFDIFFNNNQQRFNKKKLEKQNPAQQKQPSSQHGNNNQNCGNKFTNNTQNIQNVHISQNIQVVTNAFINNYNHNQNSFNGYQQQPNTFYNYQTNLANNQKPNPSMNEQPPSHCNQNQQNPPVTNKIQYQQNQRSNHLYIKDLQITEYFQLQIPNSYPINVPLCDNNPLLLKTLQKKYETKITAQKYRQQQKLYFKDLATSIKYNRKKCFQFYDECKDKINYRNSINITEVASYIQGICHAINFCGKFSNHAIFRFQQQLIIQKVLDVVLPQRFISFLNFIIRSFSRNNLQKLNPIKGYKNRNLLEELCRNSYDKLLRQVLQIYAYLVFHVRYEKKMMDLKSAVTARRVMNILKRYKKQSNNPINQMCINIIVGICHYQNIEECTQKRYYNDQKVDQLVDEDLFYIYILDQKQYAMEFMEIMLTTVTKTSLDCLKRFFHLIVDVQASLSKNKWRQQHFQIWKQGLLKCFKQLLQCININLPFSRQIQKTQLETLLSIIPYKKANAIFQQIVPYLLDNAFNDQFHPFLLLCIFCEYEIVMKTASELQWDDSKQLFYRNSGNEPIHYKGRKWILQSDKWNKVIKLCSVLKQQLSKMSETGYDNFAKQTGIRFYKGLKNTLNFLEQFQGVCNKKRQIQTKVNQQCY